MRRPSFGWALFYLSDLSTRTRPRLPGRALAVRRHHSADYHDLAACQDMLVDGDMPGDDADFDALNMYVRTWPRVQ